MGMSVYIYTNLHTYWFEYLNNNLTKLIPKSNILTITNLRKNSDIVTVCLNYWFKTILLDLHVGGVKRPLLHIKSKNNVQYICEKFLEKDTDIFFLLLWNYACVLFFL